MPENYDFLSEYEWFGEFWLAGNKDNKFPGVLKYSAKNGLLLSTIRSLELEVLPGSTIQGITYEDGLITLVNCITQSGATHGPERTKEAFICDYALFGAYFDKESNFHECRFWLNDLDEFCYPQSNNNDVYLTPTVSEAQYNGYSLKIKKEAKCDPFFDKLSSQLVLVEPHEKEEEFRSDLDSAFKSLKEKHGIGHVGIKQEISYLLSLMKQDGSEISFADIRSNIFLIAHLFTLLLRKTILPTQLKLSTDTRGSSIPVLMSLYLSDHQIKCMNQKVVHQFLPITLDDVKANFGDLVSNWGAFSKGSASSLVGKCILDHLTLQVDPLHHATLTISALEAWYEDYFKIPNGQKKYDEVLGEYATQEMHDYLKTFIPSKPNSLDTLGKLLTHVRAVKMHPKSNNLARVPNFAELANISEVLYLVLLIAVYDELGVGKDIISKIQDNFKRYLRTHALRH